MAEISLTQCTAEIIRLHDFFQAWFTGAVAEKDAQFAHFTTVMDPQFTIVGPDGVLTALPTLMASLRRVYGQQPGVRIWTQNHQLLWQVGNVLLCTYEEWQESAAGTTARLSSVLFREARDVPHGVIWLHVHETWMKG